MSLPQAVLLAQQLDNIASQVRDIAVRSGRDDLADRLDSASQALADTDVQVVVVGQFKQGKSALVNALVSAPVCPVDDVVATSVPTIVRWGQRASAALVTEMAETGEIIRNEVAPDRLRQHVTELAGEVGYLGRLHAEVTLPRRILADGLIFIDTPGVGRAQARASTNLTLLPQADAAIMVTDATQELTEPELAFVKQATALCPRLTCVVSKIDLQHQWRGIMDANTAHFTGAGVTVPMIATSALLHNLAIEEADDDLKAEAHIDDLAKHLHRNVRTDVLASRRKVAANDICSVGEHLTLVVDAELKALIAPQDGEQIVQDLRQAEETAERLGKRSARWQQTLSDGAGDLISDIEFDLRDRLRAVGREADQLIESSDPGKAWNDIGAWLAESVTQAVSDNFVWTHQRSVHLAEVVAQHFSIDGKAAVPELTLTGADQVLGAIGGLDTVHPGKLSIGQKLMIGMKGSYGGVLMFGLMTTLAGMALVNPISVAAGLIMGGFAYRQDAHQRLEQRRAEAKGAVRRLVDESIFQVSKEARDRMNRVRRLLRDHFITVADDLKHSLNESVRKAKNSASLPKNERERRVETLRAELQEIQQLCGRASALTRETRKHEPDRRTA